MTYSLISICLLIFISRTNGIGCGDIMPPSPPLNITHCEAEIGVDDGSCCTCATDAYGICDGEGCVETTCTSTTEPVSTSFEDCPECPFNITLVSIGNISISPCPVEEDCNCEDGLVSFTSTYLNDQISAESITFYYSNNVVACLIAEDVSNGEEIVCSIDVSGATRFGVKTRFVIEYNSITGVDNCIGTFDTSCTTDILGEYGNGCSDLVITSWTDISGGICTGNVSLTRPPTSAPAYSVSSEKNSQSKSKKRWRYKEGSESSSNSRRRRDLGSDSSSWDGNVITDSWYTNKKCVPNCYQWGLQRSLQCGCYESCTSGALNTSCYEGNKFGYCDTGVCCCGGECITTELSDSVSSESGDGYYSYAEWFADRCGLTQDTQQDMYYSVSEDSTSNGNSGSGSGRRRQLLGASFGSIRQLQSDSSSYGDRYNTVSQNDAYNDFLIETCVTYEINGVIPACIEDIKIFLPLCSNNFTGFNVTNLNASDISGIITDATFESGTNVLSAVGANFDGELGILVELIDYNGGSFEICLGNVTVSAENIDTLDVTTIDTSSGIVIINTTEGVQTCEIDGLPCFDFFFDADCPPATDDGVFRSCECDDGMTEINLLYTGTEDITVTFYRNYGRGNVRGNVYDSFEISSNDEISVTSSSGGRDAFWRRTGVLIEDSSGEVICTGYIRRCSTAIIGEQISGCSDVDLIVESWVSGDGALCDSVAIALDGSSSSENALINTKDSINNALKTFEDLDPYVKYSLIGILVTFGILMFFACYICVARDIDDDKNENREKHVNTMHNIALKKGTRPVNNNNDNKDIDNENKDEQFDDEYYDENEDENTFKKESDDMDNEYYDEEDGNNVMVEMENYTSKNDNNSD